MSSQCSDSQRDHADNNVVFWDGKYEFHDSWTCHIQNCTLRQQIIKCNQAQSSCLANWSCQQCIYGGSDLQCQICADDHCAKSSCFKSPCYSYICSDSLRAYQCYYQSQNCYEGQKDKDKDSSSSTSISYTLESIAAACKECALNDQDVDSCYECLNACQDHSCWNNCSIGSNFGIHSLSLQDLNNGNYNGSNVTGNGAGSSPILLTPNAIYGIMAMVGLICLIFGFWCGKNCNAHSLSKACCKWCLFWCDDDGYGDEEYEEESAWNWKNNGSTVSGLSHQGSFGRGKKRKKSQRRNKSVDMSNDSTIDDDISIDTHSIQNNNKIPLNNQRIARNNYGSNNNNNDTTENRNYRNLRIRFPMTPLSSRELPEQQNVEQSPDVRVAHFSTPDVRGMLLFQFQIIHSSISHSCS